MSEPPQYPSAPEPHLPPSAATAPPTPPYGGHGTPPPPYGGYGTPPGTPPGPPPPPAPPAYGMPVGPYGGPPAYDVMEAFRYGWQKFAGHLGIFLPLGIAYVMLSVIPGLVDAVFGDGGILDSEGVMDRDVALTITVVANVVSLVSSIVLYLALTRAAIDAVTGEPVSLARSFGRWRFWPMVFVGLLLTLMFLGGLILCVIPGFVLLFFGWFAPYLTMSGASPADAISRSFSLVKQHLGDSLLLALLVIVATIVATCTCGIGFIVVAPVTTVATVYTLRHFAGEPIAA